jgi:lantibiotic modifying enzyme
LIFIILFQSNLPVEIQNNSVSISNKRTDNNLIENQIKNTYLSSLTDIANSLIQTGDNINENSIHWKKILNAPDSPLISDQYYPGLYSGTAGIGYFFLKMYQYTNNETYKSLAIKSANYVISKAKQQDDLTYWSRSEYSLSDSYSSQKYGPAGISDFLVKMFEITNNIIFLQTAEKAMNSMINQYSSFDLNGKSWSYNYFGEVPVVDLLYGGIGVSSAFLNLFTQTQNLTYLQEAELGLQWVLHLSKTQTSDIGTMRTIIYSESETYPYNYTGYATGVAGTGDYLLKFSEITKNTTYLTMAKEIGNWLIKNEQNGLWQYGGVDYLTEVYNEDGYFLGLSSGSSGIGLFLLNLYQATSNTLYLNSVNRIHDMLLQHAIYSSNFVFFPVQSKGSFENTTKTDISMGLSGIGIFINKYYSLLHQNADLDLLQGINNYLSYIQNSDGLIPFEVNASRIYYDSSIFEGLTGIGLFYLDTVLTMDNDYILRNTIMEGINFFNSFEEKDFSFKSESITNISTATPIAKSFDLEILAMILIGLSSTRIKKLPK